LLSWFPSPLTTFQWHSAEVKTLPTDVTVLAETAFCRIQAMRYGAHAYGFQFHAEITKDMIEDWQTIPAYEHSLKTTLGPDASGKLAADAVSLLPGLNQTAAGGRNNASLRDALGEVLAPASASPCLFASKPISDGTARTNSQDPELAALLGGAKWHARSGLSRNFR